jgi:membrane protein DedA with SNARE-associated domain
MLLASVTDSLVTFATHVVSDLGLPGVFLLMALDATGVPIPSEATMMFAGFNVFQGHHTLLGITVAGVLGDLAGATIAYSIGYFGRLELVERHGNKLHITPARMAVAERWFARWGTPAVFFSRMVPVVRTFISFPAGAARMPYPRFAALTVLGVVPWVFGFGLLGREVGSNWEKWRHHLAFLDYLVVGLIVVGIVWLLIRRARARKAASAVDVAP